jgi:hypothetical protein
MSKATPLTVKEQAAAKRATYFRAYGWGNSRGL